MAKSVVLTRGVGVKVVFRFEGAATHAGSCEVVWFFVVGVWEVYPKMFTRCIGAVVVFLVGAVGPAASSDARASEFIYAGGWLGYRGCVGNFVVCSHGQ